LNYIYREDMDAFQREYWNSREKLSIGLEKFPRFFVEFRETENTLSPHILNFLIKVWVNWKM